MLDGRPKTVWRQWLLIALAGALGTLCRYWISGWVSRQGEGSFPWGTLAVNVLGCFLFGLIWSLAEERFLISGQTRFIMLTGFMGALTTFSTFGFETQALLQDGQWTRALGNVAANNLLGLAAVWLGLNAARVF